MYLTTTCCLGYKLYLLISYSWSLLAGGGNISKDGECDGQNGKGRNHHKKGVKKKTVHMNDKVV